MRRLVIFAAIVGLVLGATPNVTLSAVSTDGVGSENLEHVANISYDARWWANDNYGTDVEFARIRGKEYAFAGSYRNGLHIIDISKPERPKIVAVHDCGMAQGDVQVFEHPDGRWLVAYAADDYASHTFPESDCFVDLGITETTYGTFLIDVSNPRKPETVSLVEIPAGSHNQTVHPSGLYLYNSNSDLITTVPSKQANGSGPGIEVFDISTPEEPQFVTMLDLPIVPGLGTESHDITFNAEGTRAYSAAISQTVIIDTTDPESPEIVSTIIDPSINVSHQSDPFRLTDPDSGEEREFLIVEDEFAGAAGGPVCPSGGVHIYDITGDLENSPQKVGYWNIDELRTTTSPLGTCTAHVFQIHEEEAIMTIAFYNGGVRVVDLSNLAGIALGDQSIDQGMEEIAFYRFPDSNTWAAKTPWIDPQTGDFYIYGNDINRGFDVYKFTGDGERSKGKGRWKSAEESWEAAASAPAVDLTDGTYTLSCMLP